jgi:hypothetical protein
MADAIVTDVVQEVLRILTASDVVVEQFAIRDPWRRLCHRCKAQSNECRLKGPLVDGDVDREWSLSERDDTRERINLAMNYHQCKADSSEGRLEEPLVDGNVERSWNLSGGDDLKELVSTVLESTNVKAIHVDISCRSYIHDVVEQLLQGLRTNHTIVRASFRLLCRQNTTIVVDKSVVMLCHNTGLKSFSLWLPCDNIEGPTKHSGFGNALKMNHTLQSLCLFCSPSAKLDSEELVQPLIMDENGHQANSTLTYLSINDAEELSTMSLARMLRKNSSIKRLDLRSCQMSESDVQELIQSLVENHSLETLDLINSSGVCGFVFPAIMDVLLVNFTLKDIKLGLFNSQGWGLAIKKQLRKNEMYKKLHLKELEMAEPTSARVIFCGFPYAGVSYISLG